MDEKKVLENIKKLREISKKRNFVQTFDLIINLQNVDIKKPEHKVDLGVQLDCNIKPKKLKVLAVVDNSIKDADKYVDKVLSNNDLMSMKGDIKKIREITHNYDLFLVQVNYMPLFAQVLGKYLGPMNKMPSPKLGMIINPKTNLKELVDKLQKTVHLQLKKNLVLQVPIGSESEKDEVIAKNIIHIYKALKETLPNHEHNIKDMRLKLTMSGGLKL